MSVTTESHDAPETTSNRPHFDAHDPEVCEAFDKSFVAELSTDLINAMTIEELIRVIRAGELPGPVWNGLTRRLAYYDRQTLVRLAHLVRRSCQPRQPHSVATCTTCQC